VGTATTAEHCLCLDIVRRSVASETPLGCLTAWPTGEMQPFVSTLNAPDGVALANAAIVPAGSGGQLSFYASNTTDPVVDINGYFAPPAAGGLNFYAVTPRRIVDRVFLRRLKGHFEELWKVSTVDDRQLADANIHFGRSLPIGL
jgi:hypothetical protein